MKGMTILNVSLMMLVWQGYAFGAPTQQEITQSSHTAVASKKNSITVESYETVDSYGRYTRKSTAVIEMESTERGVSKSGRPSESQVKPIKTAEDIWI